MTEGRWNDEGFWDWGHNLEGREKGKPEPTPEARAGLRAFLSAGGAVADDEVARVLKDAIPALAVRGRWRSWAVVMRALGNNDGRILRHLTDIHRDLKRGVSEFFSAVRESGIDVDDSALVTAMLEVDEARQGHDEIPF